MSEPLTGQAPLGILGGTFNPVHYGHLRSALELVQRLQLAQLRLMPCAVPPHREVTSCSATHRAAMVELAVADEPVPGPFAEERGYEALALGFCLAPEDEGEGSLALLSGFGRRRGPEAQELPEGLAANPVASGLPLLEAILGGESCSSAPGRA